MWTKRIDLEGKAGHLVIERNGRVFTITSTLNYPDGVQQECKTWELPTSICDDELFKVAIEVQYRTDGGHGSNSTIHEYFYEMQRFQD